MPEPKVKASVDKVAAVGTYKKDYVWMGKEMGTDGELVKAVATDQPSLTKAMADGWGQVKPPSITAGSAPATEAPGAPAPPEVSPRPSPSPGPRPSPQPPAPTPGVPVKKEN